MEHKGHLWNEATRCHAARKTYPASQVTIFLNASVSTNSDCPEGNKKLLKARNVAKSLFLAFSSKNEQHPKKHIQKPAANAFMCKTLCTFPIFNICRQAKISWFLTESSKALSYIHYQIHAQVCSSLNEGICCQEKNFTRQNKHQ